jgi:hypothetical protein
VPKLAGKRAAVVACALGLGQAAVSASWALGGTALLDTIGGSLERWGREREPAMVAGLWLIVVVKGIVAVAAPVLAGVSARRLPSWTRGRVPRILGWIAAIILVLYGGGLTLAGLLVEAGKASRRGAATTPAATDGSPASRRSVVAEGAFSQVHGRASQDRFWASSVPSKVAGQTTPEGAVALSAVTALRPRPLGGVGARSTADGGTLVTP